MEKQKGEELPFKLKRNTLFFLILYIGLFLSIFSNLIYSAEYVLYGEVFAADGTSGTSSTENSFAGLYSYRLGITEQIGNQYNGENSFCPDKIYAASQATLLIFSLMLGQMHGQLRHRKDK